MLRRGTSAVAVALASLALVPSSAPATRARAANSRLSSSACFVLLDAYGLHATISQGHPEFGSGPLGNGCADGSCWSSEVDPETGSKQCTYSRGSLLTLGLVSRPSAAQTYVRRLFPGGYKRVSIRHADLAGIVSDPSGAGVVMAVGRTTVLLAVGAKGAHGAKVPWPGSRALTLEAARQIATHLSKHGCPLSTNACR